MARYRICSQQDYCVPTTPLRIGGFMMLISKALNSGGLLRFNSRALVPAPSTQLSVFTQSRPIKESSGRPANLSRLTYDCRRRSMEFAKAIYP